MKHSKKIYGYYTIAFMVLTLAMYGIFALTGKSFIWQGDGLAQHYPILVKFYSWLHHGSLTGWSWDLGLGADKLTTFSYYVLGDPFSYLIWFFPKHHLELGYDLLILLRLYASGLAFLLFARQRSFRSRSQLLGTLSYTFTGFSLYVSIRHPFFLLPMILFPLLAYGIDHIFNGKSWVPLAIVTGLALVSNFYFAYILAIGSLAYAVFRYLTLKPNLNLPGWPLLGHLVGAGVLGFLLAGILFIPSLLGVMGSTRATANFANGYGLFPLNYYLRLPNALLTTGNPMSFWVNLGIAGITFLGVLYSLRHFRRYLWLNVAIILMMVGTLLPAIAAVMNGGTTPSQRWLLLGCLPFAIAVMNFCDHLTSLQHSDLTVLVVGTLVLLTGVWAANGLIFNNHPHDFVLYGLLLLTLGLILMAHLYHWQERQVFWPLLILVGLNVVANGYGYFSPNSGGASQQLVTRGVATKYQKNYYDGAQAYVKRQKGFKRSVLSKQYYYANEAKTNLGMNLGAHDIMSYFSIQNGAVGDFSQALGNSQFKMNKPINQADSRTTMSNLLGVKYVFARKNQVKLQAFGYGDHLVRRQNGHVLTYKDKPVHNFGNNYGTVLLKSHYALPLAYLQTHVLSTTAFNRMSYLDREQALTTGALFTGPTKGVAAANYHSRNRQVPYRVTPNDSTVIDSLPKVVTYRQQGNQLDPNLVTAAENSLRQKNQDRSVNIHNDQKRLKQLARQNQATLTKLRRENQHGLKVMTSDNQNQPITTQITVTQPQRTRHTELYLDLSGIQVTRFSVGDKYQAQKNTNAFQNQAYTGVERLNTLRSAIWNQSDGAYTFNVTNFRNFTGYSQLGQSNLSDYQQKDHVLLNLGYSGKPRRKIKVTFQGVKTLRFKSVKVIAVPFGKAYNQRMLTLKRQGLQHLKVQRDQVTGTANADRTSILTTSIPYSTGWHLTVDGRETPISKVNVGFVGARVTAGQHRIKLTYQTPGLKMGMLLSGLGVLLVIIGGIWTARKPK